MSSGKLKPILVDTGITAETSMVIDMTWQERITINPEQCGGRPCIRGMRIRVIDILDLLATGLTHAEILADFPDLEAEDVVAAIRYASQRLDHPVVAA